jgi:hypothetical protein
MFYRLLPNHSVAPIDDVGEWAAYMEQGVRAVAKTTLVDGRTLSTVFLALDHGHPYAAPGERRPVLFETALLNDVHGCKVLKRYCTWAEAEVGHLEALERLLDAQVRE